MTVPLQFTHSDFKSPVFVYPEAIGATLFAPTKNTVVIVLSGGAPIPVEGTLDEVTKQITDAKARCFGQTQESVSNGI